MNTAYMTTMAGVPGYRSLGMSAAQAEIVRVAMSFMPGVQGVEIVAQRGQHYVCWLPADEKEQQEIWQSLFAKELEKATGERGQYQFYPCGDGGCVIFSIPEKPGEMPPSYLVKPDGSCDCPQFTYRLRESGLMCKHALAWRMQRQETGDRPVICGQASAPSAVDGGSFSQALKDLQPTPKTTAAPKALTDEQFQAKRAQDFD